MWSNQLSLKFQPTKLMFVGLIIVEMWLIHALKIIISIIMLQQL